METGVIRLKNRLSVSSDSYGFFFYAGHGVQSGGDNFLIPVDANIPSESFLRSRSISVQIILDELNDAHNALNLVVLDACRDNPFGWSRSGSRGLAMVNRQPAESIIVYATSAGSVASDGSGRNGLFTSQLLPNLRDPGLEVSEIFRRTGADVTEVSNRQQIPAIYNQFFGKAYLGIRPDGAEYVPQRPASLPREERTRGSDISNKRDPAQLMTIGASVGSSFSAPWLVGTVHGTIAPFRFSFIELGFDYGTISGTPGVEYYSMYPYTHLAFFMPFSKFFNSSGGLYAGLGGGLMMVSYKFDSGSEYSQEIPVAAVTAGANLFDMIDISFTIRTNFSGISQKASIGYVYRFK